MSSHVHTASRPLTVTTKFLSILPRIRFAPSGVGGNYIDEGDVVVATGASEVPHDDGREAVAREHRRRFCVFFRPSHPLSCNPLMRDRFRAHPNVPSIPYRRRNFSW